MQAEAQTTEAKPEESSSNSTAETAPEAKPQEGADSTGENSSEGTAEGYDPTVPEVHIPYNQLIRFPF